MSEQRIPVEVVETPSSQRGLTEEQIAELWRKWVGTSRPNVSFARAVERAHGIGLQGTSGGRP